MNRHVQYAYVLRYAGVRGHARPRRSGGVAWLLARLAGRFLILTLEVSLAFLMLMIGAIGGQR